MCVIGFILESILRLVCWKNVKYCKNINHLPSMLEFDDLRSDYMSAIMKCYV